MSDDSSSSCLERSFATRASRSGWVGIVLLSACLHASALVAVGVHAADWLLPPPPPMVLTVELIAAQARTVSAGDVGEASAAAEPAAAAPARGLTVQAAKPRKKKRPVPKEEPAAEQAASAEPVPAPEPVSAPEAAPPSLSESAMPVRAPEAPMPAADGAPMASAVTPSAASEPAPLPAPPAAAAIPEPAPVATAAPQPDPLASADVQLAAAALPTIDPRNDARLKASPPPSATIRYEATIAGGRYGVNMQWQRRADSYVLSLREAHNQFGFESSGRLGSIGLIPVRYTDKRPFRSMTAANFDYPARLVRFSTTAETVPLQAGAQDLVSIAMQLASFARGDAALLRSGLQIEMQVADTKRATRWLWRAVADETIQTGMGSLKTLHMARRAPDGSSETSVDVWLAADHDWLPVRIKRSDAKGRGWDLVVSSLER
jgi:hypothetical protein